VKPGARRECQFPEMRSVALCVMADRALHTLARLRYTGQLPFELSLRRRCLSGAQFGQIIPDFGPECKMPGSWGLWIRSHKEPVLCGGTAVSGCDLYDLVERFGHGIMAPTMGRQGAAANLAPCRLPLAPLQRQLYERA
jgi:hypothetical protein